MWSSTHGECHEESHRFTRICEAAPRQQARGPGVLLLTRTLAHEIRKFGANDFQQSSPTLAPYLVVSFITRVIAHPKVDEIYLVLKTNN